MLLAQPGLGSEMANLFPEAQTNRHKFGSASALEITRQAKHFQMIRSTAAPSLRCPDTRHRRSLGSILCSLIFPRLHCASLWAFREVDFHMHFKMRSCSDESPSSWGPHEVIPHELVLWTGIVQGPPCCGLGGQQLQRPFRCFSNLPRHTGPNWATCDGIELAWFQTGSQLCD